MVYLVHQYKAKSADTVYLPCPEEQWLRVILSEQEKRKVNGGSEISYEGVKYRLKKGKENVLKRKGEKVTVLRSMGGELRGLCKGEIYELERSVSESSERESASKKAEEKKMERKKTIPAADHPWRTWDTKTKKPTGYPPVGNKATD